jgi:hypothetical protein
LFSGDFVVVRLLSRALGLSDMFFITMRFAPYHPYSRGGSSLVAANIQLLCARANLAKHDNIEPSKDLCTLRYPPKAAVETRACL